MYFIRKCEKDIIEVPVEVIVKVPEKIIEHDTVYIPKPSKPITKIDSIYYDKWKEVKGDFNKMDSLYKEAIAIKEYNEVIDGTYVESKLYAKTRGDLLEYQLTNKIKERTIKVDTIIPVEVPRQAKFFVGLNAVAPTNKSNSELGGGPKLIYMNKKNNTLFDGSYDFVNKNINFGIAIKF